MQKPNKINPFGGYLPSGDSRLIQTRQKLLCVIIGNHAKFNSKLNSPMIESVR